MGRPETVISDRGLTGQFAAKLRELRLRAGLTYRQLSERTGYSQSVLSEAASGRKLPTWQVTYAYVEACNGEVSQFRNLLVRAKGARKRPPMRMKGLSSFQPPSVVAKRTSTESRTTRPDPLATTTAGEFVRALNALRSWAGASLRALPRILADRTGEPGRLYALPRSTVSEMLRSNQLPREDLIADFVEACCLADGRMTAAERGLYLQDWQDARHALNLGKRPLRRVTITPSRSAATSRTGAKRTTREAWSQPWESTHYTDGSVRPPHPDRDTHNPHLSIYDALYDGSATYPLPLRDGTR
ncbi:helix-turn-helix domain-containing protein [Nonomuraea sp. NPDC050556]|uniref:helix-turn-helix domain-containing protein n=1 Tax=Nonomuraea sp. NPDC050556 TaxID=3364369 RepID=UPI00379D6325